MDKKSAIIAMVQKMENEAALDKAYDFIKRIYRRGSQKNDAHENGVKVSRARA